MKVNRKIGAGREALRQFNRRIGVLKNDPYGSGLTLSQGSALVEIERAGKLRPQGLVSLLNLEKSSVSRLISVLEEKNLITVGDDPNDGRGKVVGLTAAGKRMVGKINEAADSAVEELYRFLSAEEQVKLEAAFLLMSQSLRAAAEAEK